MESEDSSSDEQNNVPASPSSSLHSPGSPAVPDTPDSLLNENSENSLVSSGPQTPESDLPQSKHEETSINDNRNTHNIDSQPDDGEDLVQSAVDASAHVIVHASRTCAKDLRENTSHEFSAQLPLQSSVEPAPKHKQRSYCGPRTPEPQVRQDSPLLNETSPSKNRDVRSSPQHSPSHRKPPRTPETNPEDKLEEKKQSGENVNVRQIMLHDEHVELDYDEDEDASNSNENYLHGAAGETASQKAVSPQKGRKQKNECEADKADECGEVKEGEGKSDDGEIQDDDCEEGEIKDDEKKPFVRTQPCRFFKRGHCTWGYNCRFLHPGVNDKGNYSLIDRPGMIGGFLKPVTAEAMEQVNVPPPQSAFPAVPKTETAWERGLRQAKEAVRRASRKKETEVDLERKKLSISLSDAAENKENEKKYRDPYYDNADDADLSMLSVQPQRSVEPNNEGSTKLQWQGGQYENFEVRWSREAYASHIDSRTKDPPLPDAAARRPIAKAPAQYETRGGTSLAASGSGGPPALPRKERASPPSGQERSKPGERSREDGAALVQTFQNRPDDWHDPWQRSRESKLRRRSTSVGRQRRRGGSRGSISSGSSGSSYSRSRSASYSSSFSGGSSRSSSASSASSRSSTKSVPRGSPHRGPGSVAFDRKPPPAAPPAPQLRKPLLPQPLLPLPSPQPAGGMMNKDQYIYKDEKPLPQPRRGRDWPAPGPNMPLSSSSAVINNDSRGQRRLISPPPQVHTRHQAFSHSAASTTNASIGLRDAHSRKTDRAALPARPSIPMKDRGPVRQNQSGSSGSGSLSSRSPSPLRRSPLRRSPPRRSPLRGSPRRRHPSDDVDESYKLGRPRAIGGSIGSRNSSPADDCSSSRSPLANRAANTDSLLHSPPGDEDDVYGDLDKMTAVPFIHVSSTPVVSGVRESKTAAFVKAGAKEGVKKIEDRQLPRPAGGVLGSSKPKPAVVPAVGMTAPPQARGKPVVNEPLKSSDYRPGFVEVSSRPPAKPATAATPVPQVPPEVQPIRGVGLVQKSAIKLTLISKPTPISLSAKKRTAVREDSLSPPLTGPPAAKRAAPPFLPQEQQKSEKPGVRSDKAAKPPAAAAPAAYVPAAVAADIPGLLAARQGKLPPAAPLLAMVRSTGLTPAPLPTQPAVAIAVASAGTGAVSKAAVKKTTSSRREELLKQLKAVEDAIARKRGKV